LLIITKIFLTLKTNGKLIMRIAVISDVHGNLEALEEVLADIDRLDIEESICLGDNIGYGPEPEEVLNLLRSRDIPSVVGNHELGLLDKGTLRHFNPLAAKVLMQTEELLSQDSIEYIKNLPTSLTSRDAFFIHGCPPDSVDTYLFELAAWEFKKIFTELENGIFFVGHTHELQLISFSGNQVIRQYMGRGTIHLNGDEKYIINAGSVGQPRDGNNNAKYVIWDDTDKTIEVRFVPYDIGKTAKKIMSVGFYRAFADRLW
jgi:predicted phosphodiesterase